MLNMENNFLGMDSWNTRQIYTMYKKAVNVNAYFSRTVPPKYSLMINTRR
jgi:hypothetical protein